MELVDQKDTSLYRSGRESFSWVPTRQETIDGILALSSSAIIMQVNTMVVQQAEKFVYGESDFARNFVDKHLKRQRLTP